MQDGCHKQKRCRSINEQKNRDMRSHPCQPAFRLSSKRSKDCVTKTDTERPKYLWEGLGDMSYKERKTWLFHHVKRLPTKVRTVVESRRMSSYVYTVEDGTGSIKLFFLVNARMQSSQWPSNIHYDGSYYCWCSKPDGQQTGHSHVRVQAQHAGDSIPCWNISPPGQPLSKRTCSQSSILVERCQYHINVCKLPANSSKQLYWK